MEKSFLNRQYLETLSSADLISLAEDYDIEIPAELNRRFIIGELLEVAQELSSERPEMIISSDSVSQENLDLPKSYNETYLNAVLRNPAWLFVYWDISASDLEMLKKKPLKTFALHVSFFEDENSTEKSSDYFDVQVSLTQDREQYVLIPTKTDKFFLSVELIYSVDGRHMDVLASSKKIELIRGCEALVENTPGKVMEFSPVMKLSGMEELLRIHYARHKQSFTIG